jgi:lipid-A-disaccharide synthase
MVVGEASGDLLASLLIAGLAQRGLQAQWAGIGGPRMMAAGFDVWWPSERLSVFGYVDALKRLPELLWMRRRLGSRLLQERRDLFIGVDAPDFNFGLEERLRRAGMRTVHFVWPSIWAWRPHRVEKLRRAADHVLCLFPFEPALLASHGIAATYVGHPLADLIPMQPDRAAARQSLGLPADAPIVALLPGSRQAEVRHIAPLLAGAAAEMLRQRPDLHFVLPVAPGLQAAVEAAVQAALPAGIGAGDVGRLHLLDGQSHPALAACDVALVASGTATLEAALHKRPMVITYRLAHADWARMKRLSLQPWVGLPNILAREFLVPELIQDAATPEALAQAALAFLDDPQRVAALQGRFEAMHAELRQNTPARAAEALQGLLHAEA